MIDHALDEVHKIEKDMSRMDVEKQFQTDGGIFFRNQTVYVFKKCPAIKIRVTFTLDPTYNGFADGSPRDVVRSVSKPSLEYPSKD